MPVALQDYNGAEKLLSPSDTVAIVTSQRNALHACSDVGANKSTGLPVI